MGRSSAPPVFQGAGGPRRMLRRVLRHQAVVLRRQARQMQQAHVDHLLSFSLRMVCYVTRYSSLRSFAMVISRNDRSNFSCSLKKNLCALQDAVPLREQKPSGSRQRLMRVVSMLE